MLGRDVLEYDPANILVFAMDLPVSTQVVRASRKDPYHGFILLFDPARGGSEPQVLEDQRGTAGQRRHGVEEEAA